MQVGKTALHYAADNGQERIVQFLLEQGASIDVRDKVSSLSRAITIHISFELTLSLSLKCDYGQKVIHKLLSNKIMAKSNS